MKKAEVIMHEIANEHSYDDWGELMNDCHPSLQEACTKEAMEAYANQFRTRWIPVTERLPEKDGDCMVYFNDGHMYVLRYYKKVGFFQRDVTHWSELPPAPEEVKP